MDSNNGWTTAKVVFGKNTGTSAAAEVFTIHESGALQVEGTTVVNGSAYVVGDRIEQNSIDSSEIQNNTLTNNDIADDTVRTQEITDGTIMNVDVNASAAIAGTKISPNFGTQTVTSWYLLVKPGGSYPYIDIWNQSHDKIYADNSAGDSYGGGMWFRVANNDNSGSYDALKIKENGRVQIPYDPTVWDDVWNRDYNDARYINVGESGDSIANDTIDSSEIENNTLTASDLAPDSVGNSELIAAPSFSRVFLTTTSDASLSSTNHGLTLWNTTSTNLAIDGNEIVARNNGVASNLNLNIEGGWVVLNNGATGRFSVWTNHVTGTYWTVRVSGTWKGSYDGYGIEDNMAFISNGTSWGIIDDTNNKWMFYGVNGWETRMYHAGTWRLRTHASGIQLNGATQIDNVTCIWNCF